jgi:hypothetical protein
VPRTYHNGVKGTFMDQSTHNRYFRDIATNQDGTVQWDEDNAAHAVSLTRKNTYEQRIEKLIHSCTHITSPSELFETYHGNDDSP